MSHSVINHQDPLLIKTMLEDTASVFAEAMSWDRSDVKTLTNRVTLLQYEFAHTMPFNRGTAAIAEWLEMAIYFSHGLQVSYNPAHMVNLEALSLSFPEFVSRYDTAMIHLEPLTPLPAALPEASIEPTPAPKGEVHDPEHSSDPSEAAS